MSSAFIVPTHLFPLSFTPVLNPNPGTPCNNNKLNQTESISTIKQSSQSSHQEHQ